MACEYLSVGRNSERAGLILAAMRRTCPGPVTASYSGKSEWLMLWGVGKPEHAQAWRQHVASGRPVAMWDLGYFGKAEGYLRVGVNSWHPMPEQIDRTPTDGARWDALGIQLREDYDPAGPIILIGMGPKSHRVLKAPDWERQAYKRIKSQYPGRPILLRVKPGKAAPAFKAARAQDGPISEALMGASLVVCRHSNCAVDAAIAGIPFECEDGAAMWLQGKPYTRENRLDFLRRLAWWNWRPTEAPKAWEFLRSMAG